MKTTLKFIAPMVLYVSAFSTMDMSLGKELIVAGCFVLGTMFNILGNEM